MPLQMPNAQIPAGTGGGGGVGSTMFSTLGSLMQIKEQQAMLQQRQVQEEQQRQAMAMKQREMEDDDAIRQALPQFDRPDEAVNALYKQGRASAAAKLGKSMADERKASTEAYGKVLENTRNRLEVSAQALQGVNDTASLRAVTPFIGEQLEPIYGKGIYDLLGTEYDPVRVKRLMDAGTKRSEKLQAEQATANYLQKAYTEGQVSQPLKQADLPEGVTLGPQWSPKAEEHFRQAVSNLLPSSENKTEWFNNLERLHERGLPDYIMQDVPKWDDAHPEQSREAARKFGMSVKEQADVAHQKTTEEHQTTMEGFERRRVKLAEDKANEEGTTGAGPKPISPTRLSQLKQTRDSRNRRSEEWLRKQATDESGNYTDDVMDEFVRQRLQSENDFRGQQGRQSLIDAADKAAVEGNVDDYENIRKVYENLTLGRKKLSDDVAPPEPSTPAGFKARARILLAEKNKAGTTPERKAEIDKELLRLGPK